jgi:hypothetical protein
LGEATGSQVQTGGMSMSEERPGESVREMLRQRSTEKALAGGALEAAEREIVGHVRALRGEGAVADG